MKIKPRLQSIHVPDEVSKIVRSGNISVAAQFLGYFCSLVSGVVIARIVGAEVIGIVAVGLAIQSLIQVFAVMGTDRGILKYVSDHFGQKNLSGIRGTVKFARLFTVSISLLFVVAYFLLIRGLLPEIFPNVPHLQRLMDWFIPVLPVSTLIAVNQNILISLQKPYYSPVFDSIVKASIRAVFVIILVLWLTALSATIIATVVSVVITFMLFEIVLMIEMRSLDKQLPISSEYRQDSSVRDFLYFSIPLVLIPLFNIGQQKLDILFTSYYVSSVELGRYAVIKNVGILISSPLLMFGGVTAATISKVLSSQGHKAVKTIYEASTRWITFLSGGIFVFVFVFARNILGLFGPEFEEGEAALRIFSVGQMINACVGPTNYTLLMLKHKKLVLFNSFLIAVISVILIILLVPRFGVLGAASASSIGMGTVNIISLFEVIYCLKIVPLSAGRLSFTILAIVITIVVSKYMDDIFADLAGIIRLAISCLACGFCYIGLMCLYEAIGKRKDSAGAAS